MHGRADIADPALARALAPHGRVDAVGARALVDGYRRRAGGGPTLRLADLRGAATGLVNYVCEQVEAAFAAGTTEDRRYADRSVRHLLTHLPTRTTLERLLDAVA